VALWRLPRPDFHRLVDTDFQDTPLTLWPARSPSRLTTISVESSDSFVASAAVSIATEWNEPVPGVGIEPRRAHFVIKQNHVSSGPPAIPEGRISRFRF